MDWIIPGGDVALFIETEYPFADGGQQYQRQLLEQHLHLLSGRWFDGWAG